MIILFREISQTTIGKFREKIAQNFATLKNQSGQDKKGARIQEFTVRENRSTVEN
jgi:hypothetical protein